MLTARREKQLRCNALQKVPFFAACSKKELEQIDALGVRIDVAPGRMLTEEGTDGHECFVTLSGIATATREGHPVGMIGPGSIAGEMALLGHTTRNATVVADTPMQLLVLDKGEFARLLTVAPHIAATIDRIMGERRVGV